MKRIKPYFTFTSNVLKTILSYKANVIGFYLGDMMILLVTYYLWKAIFTSSPEAILKGFDFNEMIIYVILSFVTSVMVNAEVSGTINREVKDGSIAMNLIRPINYEKRMFFEGLGNVIYNLVLIFIVGFGAVLFLSVKYTGSINVLNIVLYMLSTALGFVINFYYSYALSLLTFKITNMWGLYQIMNAITQLLSGALIPIVFFPNWAQTLFNFFPFKSIIYTPCMLYLGKLSGLDIIYALGIQVLWVVILIALSRFIWKALIKNLTILGG